MSWYGSLQKLQTRSMVAGLSSLVAQEASSLHGVNVSAKDLLLLDPLRVGSLAWRHFGSSYVRTRFVRKQKGYREREFP